MSERFLAPHEQLKNPEQPAESLRQLEETGNDDKEKAELSSPESIAKLQEQIEKQSIGNEEYKNKKELDEQPAEIIMPGTQQELKNAAYGRTMKRVQSKLTAPQRLFSRFAHHPAIDTISSGLGATTARPSGILGGSIFALFGSGVLLYMGKSYGFSYNYFAFFGLLITGFVAGLVVEFCLKRLKRHK